VEEEMNHFGFNNKDASITVIAMWKKKWTILDLTLRLKFKYFNDSKIKFSERKRERSWSERYTDL
jgi:hypothetical protein